MKKKAMSFGNWVAENRENLKRAWKNELSAGYTMRAFREWANDLYKIWIEIECSPDLQKGDRGCQGI